MIIVIAAGVKVKLIPNKATGNTGEVRVSPASTSTDVWEHCTPSELQQARFVYVNGSVIKTETPDAVAPEVKPSPDDAPTAPDERRVAQPYLGRCPKCNAELAKRSGKFGPFIGCTAYPRCRYLRNIEGNQRFDDGTNPDADEEADRPGNPVDLEAD